MDLPTTWISIIIPIMQHKKSPLLNWKADSFTYILGCQERKFM